MVILSFFIIRSTLSAQIMPWEGGIINYRIIGFSFPPEKNIAGYKIEIAPGNYNAEDSFRRNITVTENGNTNKIIAEVPRFGEQYTWQVTYTGANARVTKSKLHHFSTLMDEYVDTSKMRLRILQPAIAHKDDYVMAENGGVIYDMQGSPVWCISDSCGLGGKGKDIKFTPQGSITFILGETGIDIDYNSHILWSTPGHDSVCGYPGPDLYHNDFSRLANGHYMVLGMEYFFCHTIYTKDSVYIAATPDRSKHSKKNGGDIVRPGRGRFAILIELDENRNVVWSWKSSDYLLASDYVNYMPKDTNQKFEPHDNGFYYDEKNQVIYLSFRNLNRIIKIDRASGKVLNAYGEVFKRGVQQQLSGPFDYQHSIGRTTDGYLYTFSNNHWLDSRTAPTVVMMKEPETENDTLKKVWEYPLSTPEYTAPMDYSYGGNVVALADSSMFVCMGSHYPKMLILNRDKQILWSAVPEKYNKDTNKWEIHEMLYRGNIISRESLERMIWAAGTE